MVKKVVTNPSVFIVESLQPDDEKNGRFEGKFLSHILRMDEKDSQYYYIPTKRELQWVLRVFRKSKYRYLHLSCHGIPGAFKLTLDTIPFSELGDLVGNRLNLRRLFISACGLVNEDLAEALMPSSGCVSIIGPPDNVCFGEAAITWASFYHLIFEAETGKMTRKTLEPTLQAVVNTFGVPLNYCRQKKRGYELCHVAPSKEMECTTWK